MEWRNRRQSKNIEDLRQPQESPTLKLLREIEARPRPRPTIEEVYEKKGKVLRDNRKGKTIRQRGKGSWDNVS